MKRYLSFVLLFSVLSACSSSGPQNQRPLAPDEPTIADLGEAQLPEGERDLPVISLQEIRSKYRQILLTASDPDIRFAIQRRLADIQMMLSEERQLDELDAAQPNDALIAEEFQQTIEAYEKLLVENPDRKDNDRLLYQLSKAYDLKGEQENSLKVIEQLVQTHEGSAFEVEANFRRAEQFFSKGEYREAEQAYRKVVDAGPNTQFYANALYMEAWSQFKRTHYEEALKGFSQVLDLILPMAAAEQSLSKSQLALLDDTLRVSSLSFFHVEGAETANWLFAEIGPRHYENMMYQRLGELFLSKERFRDSADTYLAYINKYPMQAAAPVLHGKAIEAFNTGGFPSEVLPQKEDFVDRYRVDGPFWQQHDDSVKTPLKPILKGYLEELARYYHSTAQQQKQAELANAKLPKQSADSYKKAAKLYQEFIRSFPGEGKTAEVEFLLAESLFESSDFVGAIQHYRATAYDYGQHKKAAEAGYALLLAYRELMAITPEQDIGKIREQRIEHQLMFADTFADDPRALAVLTNVTEQLFKAKRYDDAIAAAKRVTERQPPATDELRLTGLLVIGHSLFELQRFADAEQTYQQILAIMPSRDPQRDGIVERLAACVYKQGEQLLAKEDKAGAVEQFLRVASVAPTSPIRKSAEFDAATHLLSLKRWPEAITVLQAFRKQYRNDPLAKEIPGKLVFAYSESEQWDEAARELKRIAYNSKDTEEIRQANFMAAEFYEKSGQLEKAIVNFRSYAHTYPVPFDQMMEARYRLTELYKKTDDYQKRFFWLRKLIDGHRQAKDKGTDRSAYLAAFATFAYGDDFRRQFDRIKLSLPLRKSLKKKKVALKKAVSYYSKVLDYGVQEFATGATYQLAEMYAGFSRDLLDSDRPRGLDELALEEYEILLEEQAFPFEELAIQIHEKNTVKTQQNLYDEWIARSFTALAKLLPARYGKLEQSQGFSDEVY